MWLRGFRIHILLTIELFAHTHKDIHDCMNFLYTTTTSQYCQAGFLVKALKPMWVEVDIDDTKLMLLRH